MTEPILRVTALEKSYGPVRAVCGVDLEVEKAECISVIGPNGAGKSTFFGTIAGEHRASAGTIEYDGRDVTRWRATKLARHGISRTFQVARLFGSRTVHDNIVLARSTADRHAMRAWGTFRVRSSSARRVDEVMTGLDLTAIAGKPAGVLAQGDRKRLELGMALVQDPRVLLLDEPTAGMSLDDTKRTIATLSRIREVYEDLTIILTAHDMDVVFALSDRVVLMGQGKVVIQGTPMEVENAPETRELYLGAKI